MPILTTLGAAAARAYGFLSAVILQGIGYINRSTGVVTTSADIDFPIGSTSTTLVNAGTALYTPSGSAAHYSIVFTKYNNTAAIQSQNVFYDSGNTGTVYFAFDPVYDLFVDSSGNCYTTGLVIAQTSGGVEFTYVAKFNSSFALQWIKLFYHSVLLPANDLFTLENVVADSSGNVYAAGVYINYNTGYPYTYTVVPIKKFSPTGTQTLSLQLTSLDIVGSTAGRNQPNAVASALDSSNNLYLVGSNSDIDGFSPTGWVAKLDLSSTGSVTWTKAIYSSYYDYSNTANAVKVDSSGNSYILSTMVNSSDNQNTVHLTKLNPSGGYAAGIIYWDANYIVGAMSVLSPTALSFGTSGSLYALIENATSNNIVLVKFDSDLNLLWQRQISTTVTSGGASIPIYGGGVTVNGSGAPCVSAYVNTGSTNTQSQLLIELPANGAKTGTFSIGTYTCTISATTPFVVGPDSGNISILSCSPILGSFTLNVAPSTITTTTAALTPTSTVYTI